MTLPQPVHFVGISGIGMSALARILAQRDIRVTGSSDRATTITQRLAGEGITVFTGHDAAQLGDAKTVVVSSAIPPHNVEVVAARERGLQVIGRGTLLARLMHERKSIAVAGTHGKTTSTAMLSVIFEAAGGRPSWALGGERIDCSCNARDGSGEWFIAESDESDGSFLEIRPQIALLTNIENDHVSDAQAFERLIDSFRSFVASVPAGGVVCAGTDDPAVAAIVAAPHRARVVRFGWDAADYQGRDLRTENFLITFRAVHRNGESAYVRIPGVGAMNAANALGAIAVAAEAGIPLATAAGALENFSGVRRRFEIIARSARMTVVDDYAHHPTAVAATIEAARRNVLGPLVVVFQPHRYSRTSYLASEFVRSLRGADRVILTDIYGASERPIPGIDSRTIGEPLRAAGTYVDYVDDVLDLPGYVLERAPRGATVLMMGAGSITEAARTLGGLLSEPVAAAGRA